MTTTDADLDPAGSLEPDPDAPHLIQDTTGPTTPQDDGQDQ